MSLTGLPDIFGNGREQMQQQADTEKDELYKQIGPTESGVGLSQKNSWPHRLKTDDDGSIHNIRT